ncbi:hypothetical protein [Bremerella alba]|nr:hypothetical protein [Bremerella alba]
MYSHILTATFAVLCVLPVLGCSPGNKSGEVEVSGTATIDGEPIPAGSISFVATDKSAPTGGGVIKDGQFTGFTMPGTKKVLVVGSKVVGKEKLYDTPDSPTRDKLESIVPPKYQSIQTTPLEVTIEGAQQDLLIEVSRK